MSKNFGKTAFLALDFPYICLQLFPGNFSRQDSWLEKEKFLQTND